MMGLGSVVGGAIGAVGSLIGGYNANKAAQEQYAMQKEFAQNGIRWKVADAKAAGIHPLAALGAQTFAYNPVMVGGDSGLADSLSQMGQGIGRAVEAKMTAEERKAAEAIQAKQVELDIRQKEKNIALLDSEIYRNNSEAYAALRRAQTPPAMPSVFPKGFDGQGDAKSGNTVDGPINKYQWIRTPEGKYEFHPSSDYAQLYEDKAFIEWIPAVEAAIKQLVHKMNGKPLGDRVWDWSSGSFVPVSKSKSKQTSRILRDNTHLFRW